MRLVTQYQEVRQQQFPLYGCSLCAELPWESEVRRAMV